MVCTIEPTHAIKCFLIIIQQFPVFHENIFCQGIKRGIFVFFCKTLKKGLNCKIKDPQKLFTAKHVLLCVSVCVSMCVSVCVCLHCMVLQKRLKWISTCQWHGIESRRVKTESQNQKFRQWGRKPQTYICQDILCIFAKKCCCLGAKIEQLAYNKSQRYIILISIQTGLFEKAFS